MRYQPRAIESYLAKATKQFPVTLVTGARQVGKTTLLKHLSDERRTYVTLDDPLARELAQRDPALFLQRYTPPLLLDEIQYAPNLLPFIKIYVDEHNKPGSFWLTGSQQFHLMKGISESLAGRVGIVHLYGLSRFELLKREGNQKPFLPIPSFINQRVQENSPLGLKGLYDLIWRGSFPGFVLKSKKDRNLFYSSYVQTYLQRDVRDLAKVGDEAAFLRFLRAAAARTGTLLNLANLAGVADISPNTAKIWLSILQTSGIIYLVESYHTNLSKRLVKTPKLYFLDTGLCAYLTEWSSPETLEAGAMSGAILENWVLIEILKSFRNEGISTPFYYYRDKDKKEIDLLIIQDGKIYAIEVKKTANPGLNDLRNFKVLKKLPYPMHHGGVVCLIKEAIPLSETIQAIPIAVL